MVENYNEYYPKVSIITIIASHVFIAFNLCMDSLDKRVLIKSRCPYRYASYDYEEPNEVNHSNRKLVVFGQKPLLDIPHIIFSLENIK